MPAGQRLEIKGNRLNLPSKPANADPLVLLQHLLDEPQAVALIQGLAPAELGKLIRHIGVEDAGEIIALATTNQLQHIFDDDVWRNTQPGKLETLDSQRLKLWLEVMLETDPKIAARQLTGLGEDFVVLVFSQAFLVLAETQLEDLYSEDEDAGLVDKALEANLKWEFGAYLLLAKDDELWDPMLALLAELDVDDAPLLERVLARCRHLSADFIQDHGGLYQVLTLAQQLEDDLADEREQRRAGRGHIASQDAAHFLQLISQDSLAELEKSQTQDPVTWAYFSAWDAPAAAASPLPGPAPADAPQLSQILRGARFPQAAALPGSGREPQTQPLLHALAWLAAENPACHARRLQELAYLANLLMAGHTHQNRRYRPAEAAQAVLEACARGLDYFTRTKGMPEAISWNQGLQTQNAVKLFKLGWKMMPASR
jgi:hypothetical protein